MKASLVSVIALAVRAVQGTSLVDCYRYLSCALR